MTLTRDAGLTMRQCRAPEPRYGATKAEAINAWAQVQHAMTAHGCRAWLDIDVLPDGRYRADLVWNVYEPVEASS